MDERDWLDDGPIERHREHVEHRRVGPPGCGKTTWLARQCVNAAHRYTGDGVVVASLTRAAAAEVAGRETAIPQQNIGTLHAHAFRALERPALAETAEGIKDWNEKASVPRWKLSNKAIADPENAAPEMRTYDEDGDELLATIGVLRHALTPVEEWPAGLIAFHEAWEDWKHTSGRRDFTDLIADALAKVDEHPARPDVMMLDEAQDMSRLEMGLARKWGGQAEQLVIVGDPDQALYTWRGADPEAVFGTDRGDVEVLSQSYRVPAAVHERAVAWIERMPGRLPIAYEPRRDAVGDVVAGSTGTVPYTWGEPRPLIDRIRADLHDGTVMVLASCGYMLGPLVAELRRQGVPFHNPYRVTHGGWNPLRGASRVLAYLRQQPEVWGDEHRLWTWEDLRLWTEPLQAKGTLTRGSKSLIKAKCQRDQFGESRGGESPAMDEVLALLEIAVAERAYEADLDWWESALRHGERKTQQFPLTLARRDPRLLRETPRLIVGTIHSVKGGEADTVYLAPDLSPQAYWKGWKADPESEPHKSVYRTCYVGMTRARENLIVLAPNGLEHVDL